MKYLNDEWTFGIDKIEGALAFAKQARVVITDAPTPFALTIGGRWGSGKTSMLRALMASLAWKQSNTPNENAIHGILHKDLQHEQNDAYAVWFNPWQYQNEPNPLIPLLHEIRQQIGWLQKKAGKEGTASKAMFNAGMRTLGTLLDNSVNLAFHTRSFNVGSAFSNNLAAEKEAIRKETFSDKVEAQRFQGEFATAIRQIIYPFFTKEKDDILEKKRLVIFIDDLDRCSYATAYTLLEAVRLYLSSRHCVFVFGLDRAQVETAVAEGGKYNQTEASQYVDKLFQLHLTLPTFAENIIVEDGVARNGIERLLVSLAKEMDIPEMWLSDDIKKHLSTLLPPNPRFIKNFLNGLVFQCQLKKITAIKIEFILVHYLRTLFPDVYELLAQRQKLALVDLVRVCQKDAPPENERQRYILYRMENPLAPIGENSDNIGKPTAELLTNDRYRLMRAGAWRAHSLQYFKKQFDKKFYRLITTAKNEEGDLVLAEESGKIVSDNYEYEIIERYLV